MQDVALNVRVLRQFRIVINSVKAHFRQVEKIAGVGGAQLWALGLIYENSEFGVNDLARAMDIHQSTASNLIKLLAMQDMVVAEKNSSDRRTITLKIRPKGLDILRKAPGPFNGLLPDALSSLDVRTLFRLEKDLRKLIVVLKADERAANIPIADL